MSLRVLLLSLVTGFCAAAMFAQTCPPGVSWCSGLYRYDGMGNIRAIGSDIYIYDTAGRLVSGTAEVQRGGTSRQDYTYDTFGNRTGAGRIPGSADCLGGCEQSPTIDPATNHITSNGAQYDDAGNLIAIQNTVNGVTYSASYTYDSLGRLARATAGSDDQQFIYTADDERIAIRNGQNWTWTVRDLDGKVLREFTSLEPNGQPGLPTLNRQWAKDYIWRDGLLLATVTPTTPGANTTVTRHYHLDHLGTPRLVSNDAGVQIGIHAYYPFGAELNLSPHEQPGELMKFTGHERDLLASNPNTLDYMHARHYSPGVGRFLSVDPVEGNPQTPQSWNRYVYVKNNPIGKVDPDGRCDAAIAAVGSAACVGQDAVNGVIQDYRDAKEAVYGMGLNASISENMMGYQVLTLMSAKYAVAFLPVSEGVPTVTRYMGEGEALTAQSTGEIPNAGRDAKFRPTHITTDQPTNNATQAQAKYELGEKPTHRATVPRDRVPGGLGPTPDGRPTTSGGGSQNATNQPIPVRRNEITPLNDHWWSRFWPF